MYYLEEAIKNVDLVMKEIDKIQKDKLIDKLKKFKLNKNIKWVSVGKNKRGYGWKVSFDLDIPDKLLDNKSIFEKLRDEVYDLLYEFLNEFEEIIHNYPIVDSEKGKVIYKDRLVYPYKDMIVIQALFGADNISDFLENIYPDLERFIDEAINNLDNDSFEFKMDDDISYDVTDAYKTYEILFMPLVNEMYFFADLNDLYNRFNTMFDEYLKKMSQVVDKYKEEYRIEDEEDDDYFTPRRPRKIKRPKRRIKR